MKFSKFIFLLIGASLASFLLTPHFTFASTLRLSPQSGTFNVGQVVSVSILVNSADQAMNAASGIISFPKNLLQVTSISKGGTIMSLWVKEPTYSNANGTVNFEGVVLNPGFSGTAGTILTINFKVIGSGTASVGFDSAQVLANDGSGSDILSNSDGADFVLTEGEATPAPPTATSRGLVLRELSRDKTSPNVRYAISVTDRSFNVDSYSISLNGSDARSVPVTKDGIYQIVGGLLGDNSILVRALSKSGAFLEAKANFVIDSLSPPAITEYPNSSNGTKPVLVKGTSKYPLSTIVIRIRRDGTVVSEENVVADAQGSFSYTNAHELVKGEYTISAAVIREDGTRSQESVPVKVLVEDPFLIYVGKLSFNIFIALLLLLSVLFVVTVISIYLYYHILRYRGGVRREALEAEVALKKSMKLLEDDVDSLVSSKDNATELKHDIADVEKFVGKEIRDINNLS